MIERLIVFILVIVFIVGFCVSINGLLECTMEYPVIIGCIVLGILFIVGCWSTIVNCNPHKTGKIAPKGPPLLRPVESYVPTPSCKLPKPPTNIGGIGICKLAPNPIVIKQVGTDLSNCKSFSKFHLWVSNDATDNELNLVHLQTCEPTQMEDGNFSIVKDEDNFFIKIKYFFFNKIFKIDPPKRGKCKKIEITVKEFDDEKL